MLRRSIMALVLLLATALGACTNPSGGGSDATAAPAGGATAAPQPPGYGY